ncbi:MAG: M50 family metallopeptidase [Actinomycetes bacterium]
MSPGRADRGTPVGRWSTAGWLMGKPLGIPVYVAPTWLIVAALITWVFAPAVQLRVPGIGLARYAVSFAFAVLLYLSVLAHELSHAVVARRLGMPVRRITLQLLGGLTEIEGESRTPGREFLVAFAGPATSLVLGGIGVGLVSLLTPGTITHLLVVELTVANILVGVFNLVPGLPLDGGRVLAAGVWALTGRRATGIRAAAWTGRVAAVGVLVAPIVAAWLTGTSVDPVMVLWAALIAAFIWAGAGQALATAAVRERLPSLSVRRLTRRAVPVAADLPVSEAVRRAGEAQAGALVVVDRAGNPVGLVSEAAVAATPVGRRPWIQVGTLSRTVEASLVLSADLDGEHLVQALRQAPSSEYLVVERNGDIYGVLVTADVERAFARA